MSDKVVFEEDIGSSHISRSHSSGSHSSKMANFLVEKSGGLIKDEDQANYVLIFLAVIFFSLSIYIFWNQVAGPTPASAPQIEEEYFDEIVY